MTSYLFCHGSIITMSAKSPCVEAVLIDDGVIKAIGSLVEVESIAHHDTKYIDLNGRTLMPGFIDAHSHILWAAKTLGSPVVDIRAQTVPSYQAILAKIKRKIEISEPGEAFIFYGLDPQLHIDMVAPTRQFLDELAPENPIGIQTSNLHVLYMNSAAFELCNINDDMPTPTGSVIERDNAGKPSGKLAEAITWDALECFYNVWGEKRLGEEFKSMIFQFASNGITATTEHLYQPFYKPFYIAALAQNLPMPRVAAYQQAVGANMNVESFNIQDRLWLAGIKIHADGSPFVGNIWLTEPYLETPMTLQRMNLRPGHIGEVNYPEDYFREMVQAYFDQDFKLTIHTQGDRTIDMVLDLYEEINADSPQENWRLRLEHCCLMRKDQIKRAKQLGILCSFFINHITYWGAPIEDSLFGPERAARYVPVGSAVSEGMRISLHADTPMTDPSCLDLIQAAVTRIAGDGRCVGPEERISLMNAIKAVTIDAAFQIDMEDKLGSIDVGKYADLVILAKNPFEVPVSEISDIQVEETWIHGKRVWAYD